jgi:hypothetical protein
MTPPPMLLTLVSHNKKTGPIPVSTAPRSTCPTSCPLKDGPCYAETGPLAIHWDRLDQGRAGTPWPDFLDAVSRLPRRILWRHAQAGDLPGDGDKIDRPALSALVRANGKKRGFAFTHKPPTRSNLAAIRKANAAGFTVNLSADNLAHADRLATHAAGPVVVLLPANQRRPTRTPAGRVVAICPNALDASIQCVTCGLCAMPNRRAIIGFPAHGTRKAAATLIAKGA